MTLSLQDRISPPLQEIYKLLRLQPDREPSEPVLQILQESIDEKLTQQIMAVIEEEDRPYAFSFFSNPIERGCVFAVIDRSDSEVPMIRFYDKVFLWHLFWETVNMLRDAFD